MNEFQQDVALLDVNKEDNDVLSTTPTQASFCQRQHSWLKVNTGRKYYNWTGAVTIIYLN